MIAITCNFIEMPRTSLTKRGLLHDGQAEGLYISRKKDCRGRREGNCSAEGKGLGRSEEKIGWRDKYLQQDAGVTWGYRDDSVFRLWTLIRLACVMLFTSITESERIGKLCYTRTEYRVRFPIGSRLLARLRFSKRQSTGPGFDSAVKTSSRPITASLFEKEKSKDELRATSRGRVAKRQAIHLLVFRFCRFCFPMSRTSEHVTDDQRAERNMRRLLTMGVQSLCRILRT